MTRDEYLAFEAESEAKHEFWPLSDDREGRGLVVEVGEAVTLAGAGLAHNQIVSNLTRELGNRLLGRDCRVALLRPPHQSGHALLLPRRGRSLRSAKAH